MDLPTALVALIAVVVVAYIVTVIHAATVRTLAAKEGPDRPEQYLLSWPKWLLALVAALVLLSLLYRVRQILLPFVVGAIIAYLLNPEIDRLERKGWRRTRAIGVVFGLFLLVFALLALLVVPALTAEASDVVDNYEFYVEKGHALAGQARTTVEEWGALVGVLPTDVREAFARVGERATVYARGLLVGALGWLNRSVVIVSLLIVSPVVAFWLLRDYHELRRRWLRALPERRRAAALGVLKDVNQVAGSYLMGMVTMAVIVGIFSVIVLTAGGVAFSVLLGMLTGALYVIPYLGFPTAMVVVGLTMGITGHPVPAIAIVLGVLMAGNITFDYGVTPRVIGRRVGLHPLVVIFSVLAGASLFGFVGILLAVPLAGALKVVLLHFWPEIFGAESADAPSA